MELSEYGEAARRSDQFHRIDVDVLEPEGWITVYHSMMDIIGFPVRDHPF